MEFILGFGVYLFIILVIVLFALMANPNIKPNNSSSIRREKFLRNVDADHTVHVTSFDGQAFFLKVGESQEELKAASIVLRWDGITIYDETSGRRSILIAPYMAIRGIFYSTIIGGNPRHLALHFHDDERWQVLIIPEETLNQKNFAPLLVQLSSVVDEPRYSIFRDRHYTHSNVISGYFVTRNLTGFWQLTKAISIYVMPLYVVITDNTGEILKTIATDDIETVSSTYDIKHTQHSIIRVTTYDGTTYELASNQYHVAASIAQAAADIQAIAKNDILVPAQKRKSADNWDDKEKRGKKRNYSNSE